MLDANQAVRAARRALRAVFAEDRFAIAALKDPLKSHETWVFRCKARGAGPTVVCKLSTADETGRARIRVQYDRLRSVRAHDGRGPVDRARAFGLGRGRSGPLDAPC